MQSFISGCCRPDLSEGGFSNGTACLSFASGLYPLNDLHSIIVQSCIPNIAVTDYGVHIPRSLLFCSDSCQDYCVRVGCVRPRGGNEGKNGGGAVQLAPTSHAWSGFCWHASMRQQRRPHRVSVASCRELIMVGRGNGGGDVPRVGSTFSFHGVCSPSCSQNSFMQSTYHSSEECQLQHVCGGDVRQMPTKWLRGALGRSKYRLSSVFPVWRTSHGVCSDRSYTHRRVCLLATRRRQYSKARFSVL